MIYREKREDADVFKLEYVQSIEKLINNLEENCKERRHYYVKDILTDKEKYRRDFLNLLGWPLAEIEAKKEPEVSSEKLSDEGEYSVYRARIMIFDDYILTGLLFKYNDDSKRPFVIAQHGMLGTPELISGVYGETTNYNDMVSRVLARGVNIFAPQLLLWSKDEYHVAYDRQELDARLKQVGSSMVALEVYSIKRIIDYYETQKWVGNIGMVGLSYGGCYAQITAAADTRIKAVITCSFFCDGSQFIQTDLCMENMKRFFGQAEMACLVHPRKLFIEMGNADPLFDFRRSRTEFERIKKICGDEDPDWLEFTVFEGDHEFYKEDMHIKKFVDYLNERGSVK